MFFFLVNLMSIQLAYISLIMYNEEVKYHMQNLAHGEESLHVDMDIKNIFKENTISGEKIAYESC